MVQCTACDFKEELKEENADDYAAIED
jgi:hypothetical protein